MAVAPPGAWRASWRSPMALDAILAHKRAEVAERMSRQSLEGLLAGSGRSTRSFGGALRGQSFHFYPFEASALAGHDRHLPLWYIQRLRQHLNELGIRRAFDGRCAEADEKRPVPRTRQPGSRSSWDHPYVEKHGHKSKLQSLIDAEPHQPQLTGGHLFVKTGAVL